MSTTLVAKTQMNAPPSGRDKLWCNIYRISGTFAKYRL